MKKRFRSILFVLSLSLAALPFQAVETFAAEETFQMAEDYAAGKIPYKGPAVKYTGSPITIRFSSFWTKAMPIAQVAEFTHKQLERESNGKLVIKPFYSNVLHDSGSGLKALVEGISDMTHTYAQWTPGSFRMVHGMSLPVYLPSSAVGTQVAEELYPKYFKGEFDKVGVYNAFTNVTPPHVLLTKKPVRNLEDLKGMKIFSGGGIFAEYTKALGAVPVMLMPSEFYDAFSKGVVDGFLNHDAFMTNFRVHEMGKYRTEVRLTNVSMEYSVSKKFFDGLPSDLKVILYNWFRKHNQVLSQLYFDKDAARARGVMKQLGIETITLSAQELERWRTAVLPVIDKFLKENESLGSRQFYNDLIALNKKYSAMTADDIMKKSIESPTQGIIKF
jgi:TRAP-type C4-dicarboxylate transport system substrate-binding protein